MGVLSGKRALITGGRQGIGRAIVDAFLDRGADVITCGRASRPAQFPTTCQWHTIDVSQSDQVDQLAAEAGKLDVIVNNSGVQVEKLIVETTDDDWDRLMGVNAKGVFNVCRAFIPKMADAGVIINIGSISATVSDQNMALYNASKAFVLGLTRSIAVDHGPRIRCNAISPGWIMTDMADAAFDQAKQPDIAKQDALKRHPSGRFGRPDDVAEMAVWLASDSSGFVTGQSFTIDGGLTSALRSIQTCFNSKLDANFPPSHSRRTEDVKD